MTGRRIGAGVALAAAVTVVAVIVLSTQGSTPATAAGDSRSSAGTTTVQRRNLLQTDTESGTLTYANPQTVYNRLTGTITWLPNVGSLIRPGHTLFKVNGAPVILMNGAAPAFRDLNGYDGPGPDILELNRDLVALGDNPDGIVVDDTWQAATTAGVDVLQASLGETETGDVNLGQVVFLPGAQLVSSHDATVGSTGGGGGSSPSTSASASAIDPAPQFVSLTTKPRGGSPDGSAPKAGQGPRGSKPPKPKRPGSASSLQQAVSMLESEVAKLQAELAAANGGGGTPSHAGSQKPPKSSNASPNSSSPSSSPGSSGSTPNGGSASAVLETSSRRLVVTVDLDASKQREARVGEKVTVQMPSGQSVSGKIIGVSPVAQPSSSSGGNSGGGGYSGGSSGSSSTVPVTIALTGRARGAGLDQAAVSVNFVQAEAKHVLSVPVTALLATPGGGFSVQIADPPHKLIRVQTGLFAAGDVQVSGTGIYPGLSVTNSEG